MAERKDLEFILKFRDEATRALRTAATAVDRLGRESGQTAKQTRNLAKSLQTVGASAQRIGSRLREVGTTASFALSAPIAGAAALATREFLSFELGMIGVQKTTDATESELEILGQQFIDLSDRIPVTRSQLERLGSVAGQLGAPTGSIPQLAETASRLGVSVEGLSTEQALVNLARFSNITGTSQDQVENLGSSLVALGNNFAAFEGEILNLGLRLAAAGDRAGLTEGEILGISTALTEVGVRAQVGGTAISKVFDTIAKSIALGGSELRVFASTTGQTVDEFRQSFGEDAAGTFLRFIQGLRGIQDEGGNAVTVLNDLGLADQRLIRAIGGLIGNVDGLEKALKTGNQAFEENVALSEESERFFAALSNQFQVLRNQFKNTLAILGRAFRPILEDIIASIGNFNKAIRAFAERFENAEPAVKRTVVLVAGFVAALGPALVVLGSFGILLGGATQALGNMGLALGKVFGVLKKIRFAALLTNPLGIAATVILGLVAAFFKFRDSVIEVGDKMFTLQDAVVATFELITESVSSALQGPLALLNQAWTSISGTAASAFEDIQEFASTAFSFVLDVAKFSLNNIVKAVQLWVLAWKTSFRVITTVAGNAFDIIRERIQDIRDFLEPLTSAFTSTFSGIGSFVGRTFNRLRKGAAEFFGEIVSGLKETATEAGQTAVKGLKDLDKALDKSADKGSVAARLFQGVPEALADSLKEAGRIVTGDPVGDAFAAIATRAAEKFSARAAEKIVSENPAADAGEGLKDDPDTGRAAGEAGLSFGEQFAEGFGQAMEDFIKSAQDITARTKEAFEGIFDDLTTRITDFVQTGKFSFKDFALSIVRTFTELGVRSLLADTLSVASGGGLSGGGLASGIGGLVGGIAGLFSEGGISDQPSKVTVAPPRIFRNAKKFQFGGTSSGGDTIPALLSPGEAVVPLGKGRAIPVDMNGGAGQTININIEAQDAESFQRSRDQFLAGVSDAVNRANRRNN